MHRTSFSLHWRNNDHGGVSNHQPHGCLLNRLFRHRSKKTSKLSATGLCAGNSPGPVNSQHKGPVTRKMVPCDDVIMLRHSCFAVLPALEEFSETFTSSIPYTDYPDSKVHVAIMGPIWGRQGPGGPHVGPTNFAIRVMTLILHSRP